MNLKKIYTLVRYGSVGLGIALLEYFLAIFLNSFENVYYVLATISAALLVMIVQFLLQKFFTFKQSDTTLINKEFLLFVYLWIGALITKTLIVIVCVELLSISYVHAQYIAILVVALVSFFVYRYIIFPNNDS